MPNMVLMEISGMIFFGAKIFAKYFLSDTIKVLINLSGNINEAVCVQPNIRHNTHTLDIFKQCAASHNDRTYFLFRLKIKRNKLPLFSRDSLNLSEMCPQILFPLSMQSFTSHTR